MKTGTTHLTASLEDYMLPCLNKEILGAECPGCGLQRAFAFLVEGEFAAAFTMYPAIYTLIALFGFLLADQIFTIPRANKISIVLMAASVLLILANFALKFF